LERKDKDSPVINNIEAKRFTHYQHYWSEKIHQSSTILEQKDSPINNTIGAKGFTNHQHY